MTVPTKGLELIERFDRNLEAYKQGKYNETQVRLEFINPFFEELGWDITNKQGYAEAYKEVVKRDINSETTYWIPGARYLFLKHQNRYQALNKEI